jgi:type II secretory pathway predicted ATPase ExeA
MYKDSFGPNRNPFELSPDPSFMCPSEKSKEALASIMYAVAKRKEFVVMTGEVGMGKTLIVRSSGGLWTGKESRSRTFLLQDCLIVFENAVLMSVRGVLWRRP